MELATSDALDSTLEGETNKIWPSTHHRSAGVQDGACIWGYSLVASRVDKSRVFTVCRYSVSQLCDVLLDTWNVVTEAENTLMTCWTMN